MNHSPTLNFSGREMNRHFKMFFLLLCGFVVLAISFYAWIGWGQWGYSVIGDYCLDMADALRIYQGDIPYRDFLPTYGALHMFLVAPLFHMGNLFFPLLWIITSILIATQLILLLSIARPLLSYFWLCVLGILSITAMAFAPTNSKFILGFSQSGFLGSFLFTLSFFFLSRASSSTSWLLAGICLGLQPFTKIDLGITATLLVFSLFVFWYKKDRSASLWLLFGFIITWLLCCAFLLIYGGKISLLLGSTLETFGQVNLFNEEKLASRIRWVLGLGAFLTFTLLVPKLRPYMLEFKKRIRPYTLILLPAVICIDAFRTLYQGNQLKHLVILNWLWLFIWTLVTSHVIATLIRRRSLRPLASHSMVLLFSLLIVSGMGFCRVYNSGWYPLNYFQPAMILLGLLWFARQSAPCILHVTKLLKFTLICCLILPIYISVMGCKPSITMSEKIRTPFGDIGLPFNRRQNENFSRILLKIQSDSPQDILLCTYEPSFYVLTGMRSAGFYTYFNRLAFSGKYQDLREAQSLKLIVDRSPSFVIEDREVGAVHQQFGIQFGWKIADYIHANYSVVDTVDRTVIYQIKNKP